MHGVTTHHNDPGPRRNARRRIETAHEGEQAGLLKELNHRVKNNLQMLLALLSSAARECGSEEARAALEAAGRRVAVIGAAQQVMYANADSTGTTFRGEDLVLEVIAAVRNRLPAPVAIAVAAADITLSNDTAVPLALILNELLTNAASHGEAARDSLLVKVALKREGDGFSLTVRDNGPGFAVEPVATKRASGLGLVRGLARQLGGDLRLESDQGARCTVVLPDRSLH